MADVYAQPSYRSHPGSRTRYPQRIGAKRDQHGRIIPTPRAMVGAGLVTGGGLSAAHDWSAFDDAFARTRSNAPGGAGPVPLPIVSSMEPVGLNGGQMPVPSIGKPEIAAPAPEVRPVASIANPPPMNNTMPGQGNTATLAPTRTLYRKPIPTALTGPDGTPAQDAANLQQTRDYFAPGGAFETEQERANRIANPPQASDDVYATAGTGKNVADPKYGTASSTVAQPVNPADEIKKKYPAIGEEGSPENRAFVDAYKTGGGNWQNAAQIADGIMANIQAPRSEIARSEYLPPAPEPVATAPAAPDTFRTSSPTPAIKEIAPQMQPVTPQPSGIAPLVRKMVAPTASASTGIAPMIPNSTPVAANGTDEDPYKRRQR